MQEGLTELPRPRAWLTVLFAAAALLALGGLLEYGTGSPDAGKTSAASYWSAFFAFNALAFGGATLIGGLPAFATRAVKVIWVALLAILYVVVLATWLAPQDMDLPTALAAWARKLPSIVPAAFAVAAGLLWGDLGALAVAERPPNDPEAARTAPDDDADRSGASPPRTGANP